MVEQPPSQILKAPTFSKPHIYLIGFKPEQAHQEKYQISGNDQTAPTSLRFNWLVQLIYIFSPSSSFEILRSKSLNSSNFSYMEATDKLRIFLDSEIHFLAFIFYTLVSEMSSKR